MGLEGEHSLRLGQPEGGVEQCQELEVRILAVGRAFQDAPHCSQDLGQHRLWVGDNEGADGGAHDDEDLEGLDQYVDLAVRQVAAEHRAEHDHNADNEKHAAPAPLNLADPWARSTWRTYKTCWAQAGIGLLTTV